MYASHQESMEITEHNTTTTLIIEKSIKHKQNHGSTPRTKEKQSRSTPSQSDQTLTSRNLTKPSWKCLVNSYHQRHSDMTHIIGIHIIKYRRYSWQFKTDNPHYATCTRSHPGVSPLAQSCSNLATQTHFYHDLNLLTGRVHTIILENPQCKLLLLSIFLFS